MSRLRAARAAAALGRAREANGLFRAAAAFGPDPAVDTAWGLLFVDKYQRAEAVKSFQQALAQDAAGRPHTPAWRGRLLKTIRRRLRLPPTRALEIDPHLADAELLLAELDLDNTQWAAARERIDRVLAWNPSHLDALALAAAITYVRGDTDGFEGEVARALAINPVVRRDLSRRGGVVGAQLPLRRGGGLAREAVDRSIRQTPGPTPSSACT